MRLPVVDISDPSIRALYEAIQQLQPKTGTVTLTTSSTTTTVSDPRVGTDSVVLLQATNNNAASDNVWVSSKDYGEFVISHASDASTRTFDYVVV